MDSAQEQFRLYNHEGLVKIEFPSDAGRERLTQFAVFENDTVRIGHIGNIVHSDTGPAVLVKDLLLEDGTFSHDWVVNGMRHKIGAPAIVRPYAEGWWESGKRHRFDGPAVIDPNRNAIQWWVRGKEIKNIHELLDQHELNPDEYQSWTDADRLLVRLLIAGN